MRRGLLAGVVALCALAVTLGARAELDGLQFRLHEGEHPQHRWDGLAERPLVRPPAEPHAGSGGQGRRLDEGEAVTLLLPGGADLLLRDRGGSAALSELRVTLSRDGAAWLAVRPKAQLYYDFADFNLLRLVPKFAILNGGFGKAYRLGYENLRDALA